MRRVVSLFIMLVIAAVALPLRAEAYDTWCVDDPVVDVGGRLLHIQVKLPIAEQGTWRSTNIRVIIPQNVSGSVKATGSHRFPINTTIDQSGPAWDGDGALPVVVVVDVVSAKSFAVEVVVTPLGGRAKINPQSAWSTTVPGTTNSVMSVPVTLR